MPHEKHVIKYYFFLKIIIIINYETKKFRNFYTWTCWKIEAKYYKNPKFGSPVAIVLHPHPQYGGTMNNRIVQLMYNIFLENGFSVIKVNFRGVGKSDGVFDNGQGELI